MAQFKDDLAWLDGRQDIMVETVKDWSRVNTGTENIAGLKDMAAILKEAFSVLGAECTEIPLTPGEDIGSDGGVTEMPFGTLLHFKKRPNAKRKVLLTGHYDTVFPVNSPFQTPKFLDDNTLNGPGVADMKGGLLVMLNALQVLEQSQHAENLGWEIILNPDEETGSIGSAPILADRAPHADFGLTFEPSALPDGTLAGERKGSGNFVIVIKGLAAHAGREFDKGRNAVWKLSQFITDLYSLNGQRNGVTINPGIIEGGIATNVVPDMALCRYNIRVETVEEMDWVQGEIDGLVAKVNKAEGFSGELVGTFNRPPKTLSPKNLQLFDVLKACGADLGLDINWIPTGGCCDGNNLAAAGLPNIDTLGVRGGLIHSDKEYLLVDSFAERAKLSALVLLKYAAGEFKLNSTYKE